MSFNLNYFLSWVLFGLAWFMHMSSNPDSTNTFIQAVFWLGTAIYSEVKKGKA
jgi:heme/copper-type cytochrome/quinol oxidase subunit 4